MLVRDAMSTVVLTIGPAHTLRQAACLMSSRRVGAAVVHDEDSSGPRHPHRTRHPQLARPRPEPGRRDRGHPHHDRRRLRRPRLDAGGRRGRDGPRRLPPPDRARRHRTRRHRLGPRHHPLLGTGTTARTGLSHARAYRRARVAQAPRAAAARTPTGRIPRTPRRSGPPSTTSDPVLVVSRAGPGPRPPAACRSLRPPDGS